MPQIDLCTYSDIATSLYFVFWSWFVFVIFLSAAHFKFSASLHLFVSTLVSDLGTWYGLLHRK